MDRPIEVIAILSADREQVIGLAYKGPNGSLEYRIGEQVWSADLPTVLLRSPDTRTEALVEALVEIMDDMSITSSMTIGQQERFSAVLSLYRKKESKDG